ncbi:MAG: phosphoribosylanthranilate isomerase [Deltaproteobacteria bacterium]|nr:phosphoribosylanthranilate isomerase [Deltaproteobacteria bacterium]
MDSLQIKVCGMRDRQNIQEIASLRPDYMGFIFYPESSRYCGAVLDPEVVRQIAFSVGTVGVFVGDELEKVIDTVTHFGMNMVQLHGAETPEYCENLKLAKPELGLIKAFGIDGDEIPPSVSDYADVADYFLFDTRTASVGGSGKKFDWDVLRSYRGETPFFLAGGIGDASDVAKIRQLRWKLPRLLGIDINSRVEQEVGIKSVKKVREIIEELRK